jgi:hypothetical protein
MSIIPEDESLQFEDLYEESSIESSFRSQVESLELLGSDMNSEPRDAPSLGSMCWAEDSIESALLSEDTEISESMDDDGDSCDIEVPMQVSNLFRPLVLPIRVSKVLAKITEHTRETSASCRSSQASFTTSPISSGRSEEGVFNSPIESLHRFRTDETRRRKIYYDAAVDELGESDDLLADHLGILEVFGPNIVDGDDIENDRATCCF